MEDWKKVIQDMEIQKHPKVEKKGIVKLKFLNDGKLVTKEMTGFSTDSVVFLVEQNGDTKELWFTMLNPILKDLVKIEKLSENNVTFNFTGEGRDMRCEILEIGKE